MTSEYLTHPVLNRYEEARIIGLRATQIAHGDPPQVDLDPNRYYSVNDVARMEYQQGRLQFELTRTFPDGRTETYAVGAMRPAK